MAKTLLKEEVQVFKDLVRDLPTKAQFNQQTKDNSTTLRNYEARIIGMEKSQETQSSVLARFDEVLSTKANRITIQEMQKDIKLKFTLLQALERT